MSRLGIAIFVVLALGAPTFGCDKPASGEGYWYVVRSASFVYDFTQKPAMVYGEIEFEVTHKAPIKQICLISSSNATDGGLRYALIPRERLVTPGRLKALEVHAGKVEQKGKTTEFLLPVPETAPKERLRIYVQAPIEELTGCSSGGGRLTTQAPAFMVPCDNLAVRVFPPQGEFFVPDKAPAGEVQSYRGYRMRGMFQGPDQEQLDAGITQALYVVGREDTKLPETGYYFKKLKPAERIEVRGALKSIRAEGLRKSLLIGVILVGMVMALAIIWRLASASAGRRAAVGPEDLPT